MKEKTLVRENLMNVAGYSPYCGGNPERCYWPRTEFNGEQFVCPNCKWKSSFPPEFIKRYKEKWNK